ncbi:hypothetical protein [Streptomyces sp. DvalAA-19]|uniref:hypothetical protein n=1 Tax=Streptomyces sp. DvalAA-19 TaxID=1839761 RepID=UPI00030E81AE|nr:hypothetical protein [Streptomyces sp. DvalAA-19]MYR39461.1 hypothetical protein [Streptomyces sp. SID4944]SCE15303.1 hypothetical protein GA0115244_117819 [Streptomyces sp. DvalAA-19]
MGFDGTIWRLRRGTDLVGEIAVDDADFPWLYGRFIPGPAFEPAVRQLFDRELVLMERLEEDESDESAEAWERVYGEVNRTFALVGPAGAAVAEFLLHIQGDRAWFRWSDTPFSEEGL